MYVTCNALNKISLVKLGEFVMSYLWFTIMVCVYKCSCTDQLGKLQIHYDYITTDAIGNHMALQVHHKTY